MCVRWFEFPNNRCCWHDVAGRHFNRLTEIYERQIDLPCILRRNVRRNGIRTLCHRKRDTAPLCRRILLDGIWNEIRNRLKQMQRMRSLTHLTIYAIIAYAHNKYPHNILSVVLMRNCRTHTPFLLNNQPTTHIHQRTQHKYTTTHHTNHRQHNSMLRVPLCLRFGEMRRERWCCDANASKHHHKIGESSNWGESGGGEHHTQAQPFQDRVAASGSSSSSSYSGNNDQPVLAANMSRIVER